MTVKARPEQGPDSWQLVVEATQDPDFRLDGRQDLPLPGWPDSVKADPVHESVAPVKF